MSDKSKETAGVPESAQNSVKVDNVYYQALIKDLDFNGITSDVNGGSFSSEMLKELAQKMLAKKVKTADTNTLQENQELYQELLGHKGLISKTTGKAVSKKTSLEPAPAKIQPKPTVTAATPSTQPTKVTSQQQNPVTVVPEQPSPTQPIKPVVPPSATPAQTPEVTFGFGQPKPTPTDQQAQSQTGQITPTEPTATRGSSGFTNKMWEDLKSGLKAKSELNYRSSDDNTNKFTLGEKQELTATRKGDTVSVKLTSPLGNEALKKLTAMAEEAVKVAKENGVAPLPVTLSGSDDDKVKMFRAMSGKNGLHFDKPIPKEIAADVEEYNDKPENKPVAPTPVQQVQQDKAAEPQSLAEQLKAAQKALNDPPRPDITLPETAVSRPVAVTPTKLEQDANTLSLSVVAKEPPVTPAPVEEASVIEAVAQKMVGEINGVLDDVEPVKLYAPNSKAGKALEETWDKIEELSGQIEQGNKVDMTEVTKKYSELKTALFELRKVTTSGQQKIIDQSISKIGNLITPSVHVTPKKTRDSM